MHTEIFNYYQTSPINTSPEFSPITAIWMAELSELAYCDSQTMTDTLERIGFTVVTFDKGGTAGFIAINNHVVIVTYRGTEVTDIRDWESDLSFLYTSSEHGRVHSGFKRALDEVWSDIVDIITPHLEGRKLIFCGHSLGGALASLSAARVGNNTVVYTYGCPRTGNSKFAKYTGNNIVHHRFVHDLDLVPQVPLWPMFKHYGHMVLIDEQGNIHPNFNIKHMFRKVRNGIRWCIRRFIRRFNIIEGLTDHGIAGYRSSLRRFYKI